MDLTQTSFMGIAIDTINGSKDPWINEALNKGFQLLDIIQFMRVVDFDLNMTMFDYFWQVVVGNTRSQI